MKIVRLALAAAGLLAMGYAVVNILTDPSTRPLGQLRFLAEVLLAHDLILMPTAIGVGALASRLLPGWARGPAHAALFASAVVTLIALPFVLGYGRPADNPSALPLDYTRGLLVVLAVVWFAAVCLAGRGAWRNARMHAKDVDVT